MRKTLKPGDLVRTAFSASVGKFAKYKDRVGVIVDCYKVRRYKIHWQDKEDIEYGWSEFDLDIVQATNVEHPNKCQCPNHESGE